MANKRMFALSVTNTDAFQSMPLSTQAIYFHLAMNADDDGFVGSPKRLLRGLGGGEDEMKLLIAKRYIIPFDSGVCVIRHWRIHNTIQSDRYNVTIYGDEKKALVVDGNKMYTERIQDGNKMYTERIQLGSNPETQVSLGELRTDKASVVKDADQGYNDNDRPMSLSEYVEKGIGHMTPGNWHELNDFMADGIAEDMVRFAVDECAAQKAASFAYLRRMLNGWLVNGYSTLEAVKAHEREFQDAKLKRAATKEAPRAVAGLNRMEDFIE